MSKCNITNKKLKSLLSFGKMPLANGFLKKKILKMKNFMNLKLVLMKKYRCFKF